MMDKGKWILRSRIIWWKRNAVPSSVKSPDNYYFTTQYEPHNPKHDFRYNSPFGGSKNKNGHGAFDYTRIRFLKQNPLGRIKRCVWDILAESYKNAHFAVYPTEPDPK